jgi:hypothetical protein
MEIRRYMTSVGSNYFEITGKIARLNRGAVTLHSGEIFSSSTSS